MNTGESEFVGHVPCPSCGSSDAGSMYSDGHFYCFKCDTYKQGEGGTQVAARRVEGLVEDGEVRELASRNIRAETCRKFGYTVGTFKGRPVQIAPYHGKDGTVVAQKLRSPDKTFSVRGDMKRATLFGQRLWQAGGKRLVITEGEIDALSYAQATNLSWPVVSIPTGSGGAKKSIAANIEWVESFDQVVFLFDNDDPGREAANECAALITPGKAAIAVLPLKDANDMLREGRAAELQKAVWQARAYRPDGLINGAELWESVNQPVEMGLPYPWEGLNKVLYGIRPREIVTLCAGTGLGKSTVCAEIAYHLAQNLHHPIGYVALEEGLSRSGMRFMALHANRPIHLPGQDLSGEEQRRIFDETLGTQRYTFYDHWGSLASDNLLAKMKYLVRGLGVRFLVLDHLSIVVSGMDLDGDERRLIDHTMTSLRSFTEETGCSLFLVSHLSTPDGKPHEEGGQVSLRQLRGSRAIGQLSDAVIGLERNQQSDGNDRDDCVVRVLKNRFSGVTGVATKLRYNHETGRLVEVPLEDFEDDTEEDGLDI